MEHSQEEAVSMAPVTPILCHWVENLELSDIPDSVKERAKHIILDGIGCALVGSKVPWSHTAVNAFEEFEPSGYCSVVNSEKRYGPSAAALLNGSFIQATELDDYHSAAPLHSASILLPALFAASEAVRYTRKNYPQKSVSGGLFLMSAIVGFEVGPRIGNGMYGIDLLSRGWHSGPVFGGPASAAASSKLLHLSAEETESAMGIVCTQTSGLMSAQYDGMVKRMQHAFAARNGLLGALLARSGFEGMTQVLDRPYGGFLAMFSAGNNRSPQYKPDEVIKDLGSLWHTNAIRFKLHACVATCHGMIEALEDLQKRYPERFSPEHLHHIETITVGLSEPAFAHSGWRPKRPITAIAAQMSAPYIAALQLVDHQVLLEQFEPNMLDREQIWGFVAKMFSHHDETFDKPDQGCGAKVAIMFDDGFDVSTSVLYPKGYDPPIENVDIVNKYRKLANTVVEPSRVSAIEQAVLNLDKLKNVKDLLRLLAD